MATIKALQDLKKRRPFKLKVSMAVMQQNWHETLEFLENCLEKELIPELQYVHYAPRAGCSLNELNAKEKARILEHWSQEGSNTLRAYLQPIKTSLKFSLDRSKRKDALKP